MDVCVKVCFVKLFFSNGYGYSSYSFCPILAKLGTYDLGANAQKPVKQIFKTLILKFWGNFLKFYIWT